MHPESENPGAPVSALTGLGTVVLLIVASTFRESLILAVTTMAPLLYEMSFGLGDGILDLYPRSSLMLMAASYIPATIIVLRRPNEGPLPAWFELLRDRAFRARAKSPR